MTLLDKIGKFGRAALAAGMIYVNTVLPMQYAFADEANDEVKKDKGAELGITLPEHLTQQDDDFYLRPEKDFEFYIQTYIELAKDGTINFKDIEKLEYVLSATIDEIKAKVCADDGKLKENFPDDKLGKDYLLFLKKRTEEYGHLRAQIDLAEKWKNTIACKGEFIHYGTGLFFYLPAIDSDQAKTINASFESEKIYEQIDFGGDLKNAYIHPKVLGLSDVCEPKTRWLNYWVGLALGLTLPYAIAKTSSRKREEYELSGGETTIVCTSSIGGYLLLDSIHPIVYPGRFLLQIMYEGIKCWTYARKKAIQDLAEKIREETEQKLIDEKNKAKPANKPEPEPETQTADDMPDPWEVKVDEDEIHKIKLEDKLTR